MSDGERWVVMHADAYEGGTLRITRAAIEKFLDNIVHKAIPTVADGCDRIEVSFRLVHPRPEVGRGETIARTRRAPDGTLTTERDGAKLTREAVGEALHTLREQLDVDGDDLAARLGLDAAALLARERGDVAVVGQTLREHLAEIVLASAARAMMKEATGGMEETRDAA